MLLILFAESGSVIESETSATTDNVLKVVMRETVGGEIEPEKICSFGLGDFDSRQIVAEIVADKLGIVGDVREKFVKPRFAVSVSGLQSETAEHVVLEVENRLCLDVLRTKRLVGSDEI